MKRCKGDDLYPPEPLSFGPSTAFGGPPSCSGEKVPLRQRSVAATASLVLCTNGAGRKAQRGSSLAPISARSTARAHWRPSRIAQTTRLWPRRMSPQAKTRSLLVW